MPVHVLLGEDVLGRQQALDALRRQVIQPEWASLTQTILKTPNLSAILEAVGAVPLTFGVGASMVEIHDWDGLAKAASDADERPLETLKTLLQELPDTRHVAFVSAKVDRKIRFPKWLCTQFKAGVQEFKPLAFWQPEDAVHRLSHLAQMEGIRLEEAAAQLLVQTLGVDLLHLRTEVRKCALYTAGKPVTVDVVQKLVGHNENLFQMLDAWISGRDRVKAFTILEEALLSEHPLRVLGLIQTQLNHWVSLRYWMHLGQNVSTIAQRTNKKPFALEKDLQRLHGVPNERLSALKAFAAQLDAQIKQGQVDAHLALTMLLAR